MSHGASRIGTNSTLTSVRQCYEKQYNYPDVHVGALTAKDSEGLITEAGAIDAWSQMVGGPIRRKVGGQWKLEDATGGQSLQVNLRRGANC